MLFTVGIFIFMITVVGAVMAGGASLKRKQKSELAPDTNMIVNDEGWEIITIATPTEGVTEPGRLPGWRGSKVAR
jgi:hypothetical protein